MPNQFVDGKWTAGSGGTVDVLNPFDASVVETVDQAGPDDVEAAVAAARAAFDDPAGLAGHLGRASGPGSCAASPTCSSATRSTSRASRRSTPARRSARAGSTSTT